MTPPGTLVVVRAEGSHRLQGPWADVDMANAFLAHLEVRGFSPATVRAYAFDLLNFGRFLSDKKLTAVDVVPTDLFDYLDWQAKPKHSGDAKVVRLNERRRPAPATMNRRVAAVRGLFEYAVIAGARRDNPVPAARRSTGLRPKARGLPGHMGARRGPTGGRLVRQPRRLPESLGPDEVSAFLSDLCTCRDKAMALVMLVGGLRAAEVRSLRLADVDRGMRQVRVVGKGNKERTVPVDRVFFTALGNYLRPERPPGCATPECFVVLRGPTRGHQLTEAGLRKVFRTHRSRSGASRVRPHRLRHTYGTELASAGIDLLALRDLMGHASPDTTARYVHLSSDTIAAEFAAARAATR